MSRVWVALAAATLAGCTSHPKARVAIEPSAPVPAWMQAATPSGIRAVNALDQRLASAVHALPRSASAKAQAEGALLDVAAAQAAPQLPPGPYHCRLVRLGGTRRVQSFAPDVCFIMTEAGQTAFAKQDGENRPTGYLYEDGDKRMIFLGTYRRAGETARHRYGDDPSRDIVGVVERVSSFRWRLILDRAGNGAALDLYELVPVPPAVPGAKPMVPGD